jgi:hypothetical protein
MRRGRAIHRANGARAIDRVAKNAFRATCRKKIFRRRNAFSTPRRAALRGAAPRRAWAWRVARE